MPKKNPLANAKTGASISRLTLGALPQTMHRQTSIARKYRRALETAVAEQKGEVSLSDAHWIDEATTCETHACVCRWLLRHKLEAMSISEVERCSAAILKAKTTRNRAVAQLGLNKAPEEGWDFLEGETTSTDTENSDASE